MILIALSLSLLMLPLAAEPSPTPAKGAKAFPAYKTGEKILFESNFSRSGFGPMKISEDDRYGLPNPTADRLSLVDAPGMPPGTKAACFTVPRAPNRFRSEVALPHESGFHERWYGVSQYVPADWKPDNNPGSDIVIQWHAIPGNGKATNPNLDIAIRGKKWVVHRAYGDPHQGPTRATKDLDLALEPGTWSNWIIRAKWSPREDGRIEIWRNGVQVFEHTGPNAYGTIGVEYTPYLKTGIYHPEWNFSKAGREEQYAKDRDPVARKQILVAKVVVASEAATLDDLKASLPALPIPAAK